MTPHTRSRSSSLTTLPPSDEVETTISDTEHDLKHAKKALVASAFAATSSHHDGTSPAAAANPYATPADISAGSAAPKEVDADSNTPVAGPSGPAKARKKRQQVTDKDKLEWMRLRAEEGE